MTEEPRPASTPPSVPTEARRRHVTRIVVFSMLLVWLALVIIVVAVVS